MRTELAVFDAHVRNLAARIKVGRDHPIWNPVALTASGQPFTDFCTVGNLGSLIQYALKPGSNSVYWANFSIISAMTTIPRAFFVLTALPGTPTSDEHRAISAGMDTLFCAVNGKVYYYAAGWHEIADFIDPITGIVPKVSLCIANDNMLAIAAVYSGATVPDHCKLSLIIDPLGIPYVDTWHGFLPKHATRPGIASAFGTGGIVYLYVDDWSKKKPILIKRYGISSWSGTEEILPLDTLDEDSTFSVGFASLVLGRSFLTGTIKRRYGPTYAIYMLGPENFTFGRDMIIQTDYAKPLQLIANGGGWPDGLVYAVGLDNVYKSSAQADIFQTNNAVSTVGIHGFNLDQSTNQGDRLSLDIPGHYITDLPADLIPGARVDLEVSCDGNSFYKLGQYGVDRVRKVVNETGQSYSIDCTSHGIKKMMDWQSDTYFDYMGQGEVHGNPGELTKLIRSSGTSYSDVDAGGLYLKSLNDSGMLYTVPVASHGGFIRAKFTNVQLAHGMIGVGMNYGEETLAAAAARLGKKLEEVKAGERGKWGLFAIYIPDPLNPAGGMGKIHLVDWNTIRTTPAVSDPTVLIRTPYRIIQTSFAFLPAANGTAWLAMQYQDGYVRVFYAPSDTYDMTLLMNTEALTIWDNLPTEHENYGRGAMFFRNNTGFHMGYTVMSDSDVVPLYSLEEKEINYGRTLEDRTDKFPSFGQIKIDDELIYYKGKAGYGDHPVTGGDRRVTTDLQWVPGKVIAKSCDGYSDPALSGWMNFSTFRGSRDVTPHVHGDNYLMQCFQPAAGSRLIAFRIWLKKVNFPEDGVLLEVRTGNVSSSGATVALLNNTLLSSASVSGSSLKADGGWVTFFLNSEVIIDQATYNAGFQYWIILKRTKGAKHPSSTTYFSAGKMPDASYPNNGCYAFCEEDDEAIGQGGDMAFVAYAKVDGTNKEYMFPLIYQAGVGLNANLQAEYWGAYNPVNYEYAQTALQTWWNGCAITITKGLGINNCYRIVRSFRLQDSMNDLMCFALDRDPGRIFGTDTKARAVPAFYGLTRGYNTTKASAHGGKSQVHNPYWATFFSTSTYFEHYSADEDLTLAEVAEAIARKSGVVATDLTNRHVTGILTTNAAVQNWVTAKSKNAIVKLELPVFNDEGDRCSVIFANASNVYQMAVVFQMGVYEMLQSTSVQFIYYENGVPVTLLRLPINAIIAGEYRVSLYDGHLSVWVGNRLLGSVNMDTHLKAWTKVGGLLSLTLGGTAKIMIPQAGTRVDNFVMDMGKSGNQLLSTLIGEKRVYFREKVDGTLKVFTDREVHTQATRYRRATGNSSEQTDIGLATRVLLEGGEVIEVSSAGNINQFGNFFKTFNISEINNLDDATYFAGAIMEDMQFNREKVDIEGRALPSIETTDRMYVTFDYAKQRELVVDSISQTMRVDENEAVYDMRISGRYSAPMTVIAGGPVQ